MKKLATALLLPLFLSSCANSPGSDLIKLNNRTACCSDLKSIKFVAQQPKQLTYFDLEKQAVRLFNEAKSPFIAIEKPHNSRFAQVFSHANGAFIQTATLVYPQLLILDKSKQVIKHLKPYEAWEYGLPTTLDLDGNLYYKTQFTLPEEAKYLIFYTDSSLNNKKAKINWRSQVGGSEYRHLTLTSFAKIGIKLL
ncbi:hypothetical protein HH219_06185 [Pseudoalteromonas sp. NEC-BIFX-2020_015]|uniref:MalM family protein n=1 Tax=Pseudoalteromonas sp. NEC-BIFX-2020_015 TaxID=2729544 RepID=UPI0014615B5A|nr:MalM family protein [Pseudoalteromonas sp. NEC-BIFX-2020_015]NMR25129.1 hypothetical protein [Pseudoalteromonas sp. NEC-BIFX-2020_015]